MKILRVMSQRDALDVDAADRKESMTMETTTPAYKTKQFWAVAVLTLLGLVGASGVVMDGSRIDEVIGWVVTVFSSLGLRGWGPSTTVETLADPTKPSV
jgi:hypothetical protein